MEVSAPISYKSEAKGNTVMLNGILADDTDCAKMIVYDEMKFPLFKPNHCFMIADFIKKPGNILLITSKTDVFTTSENAVKEIADYKERVGNIHKTKKMDIIDASTSPVKTSVSVTGKVVVSCKATTKRSANKNEDIPFKRIKVKDSTSSISIALWRDMSKTEVPVGSFVKLNHFNTTKTYDKKKQAQKPVLANITGSSIEFLPNPEEDDISDESDSEDESHQQRNIGQVLALDHSVTYKCCLNDKCYFKKIDNCNTCPKCNVHYSDNSAGIGVVFKFLIKSNGKISKYTIFTPQFKEFLQSMPGLPNDLKDIDSITQRFKDKFPIEVSFSNDADTLRNIKALA